MAVVNRAALLPERRTPIKGWKTWATAGLSILYGVGGYFLGLHDTTAMMGFVTAGFGLVGIGHKLDKSGGNA